MDGSSVALDEPQPTACAVIATPEADSELTKPKCLQLLATELQENTLSFLDLASILEIATVSQAWHQMTKGVLAAFLQNHFRQAPEAYATVRQAIGPMGPTEEDSQQAFGQGFLRYLVGSETKDSIEVMCAFGLPQGLQMRISGYASGRYGYPKDSEMAWALNEALTDQGNTRAIQRRIDGYRHGHYGYPQNPEMFGKLNESLAHQGDQAAIQARIPGYAFGVYGYPLDPEKAHELNEALAHQGNTRAMERRIKGYMNGAYGYPQDFKRARELNDTLADQGNEWAIQTRIEGYMYGHYYSPHIPALYPLDPEKSRELNDTLADQGNEEAMERRISGYTNGTYGYPENPEMARALNESRQAQRTQRSIRQWIQEYGSMGGDNCLGLV